MNTRILIMFKCLLLICFFAFNISAIAQSNDNISGATTLSVSMSSASTYNPIYTTVNIPSTATASTVPAPGCGGTLANIKDIWYKCTIPSTGKIVVSTKAATTSALTDVAMALYSGSAASPTLLICANDRLSGSDYFADIAIDTLTPGSTVYIRLWSISTATPNTGNVQIATYSYGPYCAQGNPVPNDSVSKAPSICNLDGFWGVTWTSSGTWPNKYTNAADPVLANISSSGFTIENNSWLKFAANDDTVKLDVYIYSCSRQNQTTAGPQIAIMSKSGSTYSPVGNIINPGAGPSNFNNTKQTLLIPGLTIGNTYYVMFDGYAGDLCHYNIIATKGVITVDAGADTVVCSGASINRTGTSVSGVTIKWYADKAHTIPLSNTATLSVSNITATTTYYMDAIASLTCPLAADDSFKVVVNLAPTITSTNPNSICRSGTVQLGATASSGTINWYASASGGSSLGAGATWTTPNISSTTTYYAEASNGTCAATSRTQVVATVTPNNTISLNSAANTNNQSICVGSSIVNIKYKTTGATAASFSGLPTGVVGNWASDTVSITGTPAAAGTYNYTIILSGGCGNITATGTIEVNSYPLPDLGPDMTICASVPTTITAHDGETYSWTGGSSSSTISIAPDTTTTYSVTVTKNGCSTSENIIVNVSSNLVPNIISTLPTICAGSTTTIAVDISGATYHWTTGANTQSISVSPLSNTTYKVTVTDANGCSGTQSVAITVDPFIYVATSPDTICKGASSTLTAGTDLSVNYTWSHTLSTSNQVVVSPVTTASYTVTAAKGACTATGQFVVSVNPLPNVSAGNDVTICSGSSTTLTANGGVYFEWSSGIGQNQNVSPTVATTYTVTVTDLNGCKNTSEVSVEMSPINTITLSSASNNQTICVNSPLTSIIFNTTGATGAYVSDLPSGLTGVWNSNVLTISGTPSLTGQFNYTVHLTGGCGLVTANGTVTVTSNNSISLSSTLGTDNQTICMNVAITPITYTTTGAAGATIVGLPNGITGNWNSNIYTISGTPTQSGTFNYSISLTGGCGIVSIAGTVTVDTLPTITLTSNSLTENQTICLNESITNIDYTLGNGATGATVSGLPNGLMGAYSSGVYTISGTPEISGNFIYTVSTTGGCAPVATETGVVTVVLLANPVISTDPQYVCIGSSISLKGIGGTFFNWSTGAVGSEITITPNTTNTINVYVTATDNNGCSSTSSIDINAKPLPNFSIGKDSAGCITNVLLEAPNTFSSYLWSTGEISNYILVNNAGTYSVKVTDNFGCSSADTISLKDSCMLDIFVPNSFTPNGDNTNDFFRITAKNIFGLEISIFNRWGEELFKSTDINFKWDGKFNEKECSSGTYFYILKYYDLDKQDYTKTGTINIVR
ncbi:MAG: gliding motility-associated C-terminal domain-containing protein [Bacteroidota bacterium]